jgi:5-methylcytosine-specific restriction enzyme A
VCQACGTKLSTIYGLAAEDFIHVHHIRKISSIGEEYHLDPILDLRPLCPNCHAIAHLRNDPYTIEEIQEMLMKQKGDG